MEALFQSIYVGFKEAQIQRHSDEGWRQAALAEAEEQEALRQLRALDAEVKKLKRQLLIANADAIGRTEQVAALSKAHKDSDYLRPSGATWKTGEHNGTEKTVLRSLIEISFDQILAEKGVNPEGLRRD